jgi:hypothetical protein
MHSSSYYRLHVLKIFPEIFIAQQHGEPGGDENMKRFTIHRFRLRVFRLKRISQCPADIIKDTLLREIPGIIKWSGYGIGNYCFDGNRVPFATANSDGEFSGIIS